MLRHELYLVLVPFDIGVVYINIDMLIQNTLVLVPFDIGVVYINLVVKLCMILRFSPLRYWGSLYHILHTLQPLFLF